MSALGDRRWVKALGLLLAVVVAVAGWWLQSGPDSSGDDAPSSSEPTTEYTGSVEPLEPSASPSSAQPSASSRPAERIGTDPESGLDWVDVEDLPAEAEETLELIDAGGPFPYDRDGITFGNFERILPQRERGYYAEYTVPTPGLSHRGARRIVTGDDDELYWTEDHYASFERIAR